MSDRRLKFWGWGWEGEGATGGEIAQLKRGVGEPERARTAGHRLAAGVAMVLSLAAIAGLSMLNLQ